MIVSITNAQQATWIIFIVFLLALLFSIRRRQASGWLPTSVTNELKGLAILLIVFSHIGYYLVSDTHFLQPLSNMAGIGVNIFLFFSGFGLTASQLQRDMSIREFYKKRLIKLFTPFWLMLGTFTALDFFVLHIHRTTEFFKYAVFGIFTRADLYQDFNSPLWYMTLTLGYYLLFPVVFSKRWPWFSALLLYLAGYFFIFFEPQVFDYVIHLYKVHIIAFPLGVLMAWLASKYTMPAFLKVKLRGWNLVLYCLVFSLLSAVFLYSNVHSEVGSSADLEQWMSILGTISLVLLCVIKKVEFRVLALFGIYSYEVYLWHWPLMYRYDFLYKYLPSGWPWLPTHLYLAVFIGIGMLSKRMLDGSLAKSIRARLQSEE